MRLLLNEDCRQMLGSIKDASVDVVITSPPYNIGKNYGAYQDSLPDSEYFEFLREVFAEVHRVLKPEGHFFLQAGGTNQDPTLPMRVSYPALVEGFKMQNQILWVKSLAVGDRTYGHFKPINSRRYLNHTYEFVFHLTKTGNVPVERLAIGVPYMDQSNRSRWKAAGEVRCAGDTWFIPYDTIRSKEQKAKHPAIFPEELVKRCILLSGAQPEAVVVDPFAGIGTTLRVADRMGMMAIGSELNAEYCEFFHKNMGGNSNTRGAVPIMTRADL